MIIVTAGDHRHGTDSSGSAETDGVSFRDMIAASEAQAKKFGYRTMIYDLGGLGIGKPFSVDDETFRTHGYYRKVSSNYFSKALHKPDIVAACMAESDDFTVYLDGDAVLWKPIDDVVGDYDIAVTVRHPRELKLMDKFIKQNPEAMGLINAGVIFFQPSDRVKRFLATWKERSMEGGSDQLALNQLLGPDSPAAVNTTQEKLGLRVKYLPTDTYNFYYFDYGNRPLPDTVRVMHFKAGVRRFFRTYFPA
ncbi:MAG TPA: putative nucleotide-diphospho-sugar transferase [Kofleriaceae bacterium]